MIIHKAFRFRLYPNQEQRQTLAKQFGTARFVFNHFLRRRLDQYAASKEDERVKPLNYHGCAIELTVLKRQPETVWLQEANAQALQQSLRDLDKAYNNFFQKRAAFPKFKKKGNKQSFRVPQAFHLRDGKLVIPKCSPLSIVQHRDIEGAVKSVTVTKTPAGKYFASFACEVEVEEPAFTGDVLGIDLGLSAFLTTSEGEKVENPKYLRTAERKLKHLQRKLSRCQKGSNGREKARHRVACQHEKIANQRKDFLHKLSHQLTSENQALYLEDLHVRGMLKNHHLAKSINDAGWAEFDRQVSYKGRWHGCHVGHVDRFFPSSKRCHVCGFINDGLTLKDRTWTCPECQTRHDRDHNAALNIKLFKSTGGTPGIDASRGEHEFLIEA